MSNRSQFPLFVDCVKPWSDEETRMQSNASAEPLTVSARTNAATSAVVRRFTSELPPQIAVLAEGSNPARSGLNEARRGYMGENHDKEGSHVRRNSRQGRGQAQGRRGQAHRRRNA